MKYNDNGTYKDIYVKTFDTLPIGAIVEYNGATIPDGWTDIGNNKIEKTSQYIQGGANLSNEYGTSNENGYTQEYINGLSILGLKYNKTLTTGVNNQRIKITCTKNYQCFFLYGQGGCLCSVTNMYGSTPQISGFANNATATGDKISQLELYITVGTEKEIYVYSNDDFTIEQY